MKKNVLITLLLLFGIFLMPLLLLFIQYILDDTYFDDYKNKKTVAFNAWGADELLIGDINQYLLQNGYNAGLYYYKNDVDCSKIDYSIFFRGEFTTYSRACRTKKNILWQFYADLYKVDGVEQMVSVEKYSNELVKSARQFDAVIVSSKLLYEKVKDRIKVPLYYIPQFSNVNKFYPEYTKDFKTKALFVGHPHFYRVTPRLALNNNLPVTIFGEGWMSDGKQVFGYDIPHDILHKYYTSADIVLNDTMPGMREFGFISNRIYDVSASGGFVISDYSKAIEEIFGDSIPMWKTEKEFVELVNYYLNHPDEKKEKIEKAKKITLENYTCDKSAQKLVTVLKNIENKPSFPRYLKHKLFKFGII